MKILTFILSLLVISQSLIPCCASALTSKKNNGIEVPKSCCESKEHDEKSDNKECHGICSPFFSCCSNVVTEINSNLSINYNLFKLKQQFFPIFEEKFISLYINNLWHPPQI